MPDWSVAVAVGAVVVGIAVGVVVAMRKQAAEAWTGVVADIARQRGSTAAGRAFTTVTVTCRRTDAGGGQNRTFVYEQGTLARLGYAGTEKLKVGDRVVKTAGASYPRRA